MAVYSVSLMDSLTPTLILTQNITLALTLTQTLTLILNPNPLKYIIENRPKIVPNLMRTPKKMTRPARE